MKFYFLLLQCHCRPRELSEIGILPVMVQQENLLSSRVTSIELHAFVITEEESMF